MMDVKGLVDYAVEIGRLNKSLTTTSPQIETLEKKMVTEGYEDKVPEDLKKSNIEKLESLQKKKVEIEEAIANLERLALIDKK
jgi:valyl-tRNA synthetase